MRYGRFCSLVVFLVAVAAPANGHISGGDSYLHMKLDGDSIYAQWGIALWSLSNVLQLDGNSDGRVMEDEVHGRLGVIADYALARLKVSVDDTPCAIETGQHEVAGKYAIVRFSPRCPTPVRTITLDSRLFFDTDPVHRGLVRLEHEGRTYTGILSKHDSIQRIDLVVGRPWHQFLGYVIEGMWHIWIGFDHLTFLVALLLPAVLQRRQQHWETVAAWREAFGRVLAIVTSFTVAHSLTLSVAALGIVTPPIRLVESVIALSVVVAAFNNLYPVLPAKHMVTLTFGFGLIHGFGFANVLQELGLPRGALLLSLFGFNVGVEVGQMAIVALALPFAYAWRRHWMYRHVALTFGSAATAGMAFLWFVERTFDVPSLLPSAPEVDPRAALTHVAPYLPPQIRHPLVIAAGMLTLLVGLFCTLVKTGIVVASAARVGSLESTRLMRYGLSAALGCVALGCVIAYSAARQEATIMAKASELAEQLAQPLRQQLRIAEPYEIGYQAQLEAVREAVTFLARQHNKGVMPGGVAQAFERLATGRTDAAQALLKAQAEAAVARGDRAGAAATERRRAALALLEHRQGALEAYRLATELDPQSGRGWLHLAYLLQWEGQQTAAESASRRALELAQTTHDPSLAGVAYEHLGAISQDRGAWWDAEAMYREALNTYRALSDEPGLARAYMHLGAMYGRQRKLDKAVAMYRDALSIHQRLADKAGMAVDYANLGAVYAAQGLWERGEAMYHEALKLNEALDRKPSLAMVFAELGRLYRQRGDAKQAEAMYRQALAINEALHYRPGIASDSTSLGVLYRQTGDFERAMGMLHKALSIDEALGNHLGLAINYANLGSVLQMRGALDQAEAMYQKALALNERLGRQVGQATNYANLGQLSRQQGELERAEAMYRQSLTLFREAGLQARASQVQAWLDNLRTASRTE